MADEPGSRDVRRRLLVLEGERADELRACSEHGELEGRPLKFSSGGTVYVTPQSRSVYYCPSCCREVADEKTSRPIVGTDEAIAVVVLSLSAREFRSFADRLTNLGRGTVHDGDVYLASNPPADRIPDWLYDDGGVFVVDESRVEAAEERADEASTDLLDRR